MIVWGGLGDLSVSNTGGRYRAPQSTPVVQRVVSRKPTARLAVSMSIFRSAERPESNAAPTARQTIM
jgi:hypothetical protein